VRVLRQFVRAQPTSFEGNNFLGIALAQQNRTEPAIAFLQRATQLKPGSVQAHYNLGLVLMGCERFIEARAEFETALHLDSTHALASQALQRLPADVVVTSTPAPIEEVIEPAPLAEVATYQSPIEQIKATASIAESPQGITLRAVGFGLFASVVGALLWERITFYAHYQIDLFIVAIGMGVGMVVVRARGKSSLKHSRSLGLVLAAFGIYLGQVLIILSYVSGLPAEQTRAFGNDLLHIAMFSAQSAPGALVESPLRLLFVAIGLWQGWLLAGHVESANVYNSTAVPTPARNN